MFENLRSAEQTGRLDTQEELGIQLESKGSLEEEFPLPGEISSLFLMPSADRLRPTHIMEGNLLYSKSTD